MGVEENDHWIALAMEAVRRKSKEMWGFLKKTAFDLYSQAEGAWRLVDHGGVYRSSDHWMERGMTGRPRLV